MNPQNNSRFYELGRLIGFGLSFALMNAIWFLLLKHTKKIDNNDFIFVTLAVLIIISFGVILRRYLND